MDGTGLEGSRIREQLVHGAAYESWGWVGEGWGWHAVMRDTTFYQAIVYRDKRSVVHCHSMHWQMITPPHSNSIPGIILRSILLTKNSIYICISTGEFTAVRLLLWC